MTDQTLARLQSLQSKLDLSLKDVLEGLLQRGEAPLTLWQLTGNGFFDGHPEVLADAKALLERELELRLHIAAFATTAAQRMAESPNE